MSNLRGGFGTQAFQGLAEGLQKSLPAAASFALAKSNQQTQNMFQLMQLNQARAAQKQQILQQISQLKHDSGYAKAKAGLESQLAQFEPLDINQFLGQQQQTPSLAGRLFQGIRNIIHPRNPTIYQEGGQQDLVPNLPRPIQNIVPQAPQLDIVPQDTITDPIEEATKATIGNAINTLPPGYRSRAQTAFDLRNQEGLSTEEAYKALPSIKDTQLPEKQFDIYDLLNTRYRLLNESLGLLKSNPMAAGFKAGAGAIIGDYPIGNQLFPPRPEYDIRDKLNKKLNELVVNQKMISAVRNPTSEKAQQFLRTNLFDLNKTPNEVLKDINDLIENTQGSLGQLKTLNAPFSNVDAYPFPSSAPTPTPSPINQQQLIDLGNSMLQQGATPAEATKAIRDIMSGNQPMEGPADSLTPLINGAQTSGGVINQTPNGLQVQPPTRAERAKQLRELLGLPN